MITSCQKEEVSCSINLRVENGMKTNLTDLSVRTIIVTKGTQGMSNSHTTHSNSYDSLNINSISDYKTFENFNGLCFIISSNEYGTFLIDCLFNECLEKGNYTLRILGDNRDTLMKD